jgi:hypothetical protein
MRRVEQAGAKPVTWIQVMLKWQRDWAQTGTYNAVTDVVIRVCSSRAEYLSAPLGSRP